MYSSTLSLTSTLDGMGGQNHSSGVNGTHFTEFEWAPGPIWKETKNLAHIGIRSLEHPARSESLYRLS